MRFAYADPPYPGMAGFYEEQEEVNHSDLILDLYGKYDAWALSTSSTTLQEVLALCPDGVRIAAWVKPWASFKPNVNPAYAWEPVITYGGRNRGRSVITVRDWVSVSATTGKQLVGAKPRAFAYWLFEFMGLEPDDEFTDLFPGTGAVTSAWTAWRSAPNLFRGQPPPHPELELEEV